MALYQTTIATPWKPPEAFAYMAHFSNAALWDPGVERAESLDEEPLKVGSRFLVVTRFLGQALELQYSISELEPPRRVVLEAVSSSFRSRDEVLVEPTTSGSRVSYEARLDLSGPLRFLDPLLQRAFNRIGDSAAAGLASALDATERSTPLEAGQRLLRQAREVPASAEAAWHLLVDTTRWPDWGPAISAVESSNAQLGAGTTGRLRTPLGAWLPFQVTQFLEGSEWSWRVAGFRATRHVVTPIGPNRCRVEFRVPRLAAPYLAVCRLALYRLARELAASRS